MINIFYTPGFLRQYSKLPTSLKGEVQQKITLFKQDVNHPFLKTHKLKGKMRKCYSFYVNYKYRVIFMYDSKNIIALLDVGDHDVYK